MQQSNTRTLTQLLTQAVLDLINKRTGVCMCVYSTPWNHAEYGLTWIGVNHDGSTLTNATGTSWLLMWLVKKNSQIYLSESRIHHVPWARLEAGSKQSQETVVSWAFFSLQFCFAVVPLWNGEHPLQPLSFAVSPGPWCSGRLGLKRALQHRKSQGQVMKEHHELQACSAVWWHVDLGHPPWVSAQRSRPLSFAEVNVLDRLGRRSMKQTNRVRNQW